MTTDSLLMLTAALGVLSAVLTGLITRLQASSQLKALVLLAFSLLSGAVVQAAQAHGPFTWTGFALGTATAFSAGVVAHKGDLINFLTGPQGLLAGSGFIGTPPGSPPPVPKVAPKLPSTKVVT